MLAGSIGPIDMVHPSIHSFRSPELFSSFSAPLDATKGCGGTGGVGDCEIAIGAMLGKDSSRNDTAGSPSTL